MLLLFIFEPGIALSRKVTLATVQQSVKLTTGIIMY